jgi:hypothetical protein
MCLVIDYLTPSFHAPGYSAGLWQRDSRGRCFRLCQDWVTILPRSQLRSFANRRSCSWKLTQLFAAGFNIFPPSLGLATADLETLRDNNLGRGCVVMLMATDGIPRDFGPEMPWEVQSEIWGFRSRAGGPAFVWSSEWRQMWSIEACRLRRETSSMTITSGDQRYVACLSFCGAFYVSICMKLVYWNASLGNIMPLILYITSGGWKTRPLSQNQAGDVCFIWRRCR